MADIEIAVSIVWNRIKMKKKKRDKNKQTHFLHGRDNDNDGWMDGWMKYKMEQNISLFRASQEPKHALCLISQITGLFLTVYYREYIYYAISDRNMFDALNPD